MKALKEILKTAGLVCTCVLTCLSLHSQNDKEASSLPGDNLNLGAALAIFQKSNTVEEFEKKLNASDPKVNNLDLNHDGLVDYLKVTDYSNKDHHSIIIQDPVSSSETKNVATIEIDKKGNKDARLLIKGNEELYGKDYVVEPQTTAKKEANYVDDIYAAPGSNAGAYVNVWGWPSVSYIYGPQYTTWVSPWYWGYYPAWWYPWPPYSPWLYQQSLYSYNFYPYYRWHHNNYWYGPRGNSPTYVHHSGFYPRKENTNGFVKSPNKNFWSTEKPYTKPTFDRQFQPSRNPMPVFRGNGGVRMNMGPHGGRR